MDRKEICRACLERPSGCWKNQTLDCAQKYHAAERHATEHGSCPIGRWDHRIIVGCFHAPKFWQRIKLCLDTWVRDAKEADLEVVIVQTGDTLARDEDYLYVPVPDTLAALPQQVRFWCEWALTRQDWDYLFKCDDDTYVSIPRFLSYDLVGRDYVGAWCRYGGETYAHGGAGYFLSRRAAQIVAERLTHEEGPEDLLVGRVLREAGISCSFDKKLIGWGKIDRRCDRRNNSITTHTKHRDVFLASHRDAGLHSLPLLPPETPEDRIWRLRRERQELLGLVAPRSTAAMAARFPRPKLNGLTWTR